MTLALIVVLALAAVILGALLASEPPREPKPARPAPRHLRQRGRRYITVRIGA